MDDDGKPTGRYATVATVTVLDGEKRIEKDMPAGEAVKAFLSLPENKNLIDSKFRAGGGAIGGRTPQGGDMTNMTSTQKIEAGLRQLGMA